MEMIKKYSKLMIEEITSADTYINMACKTKSTDEETAENFFEMAKQELHHKDILDHALKNIIDECEDENKAEAMNVIYDFMKDIIADMEAPVLAKMKTFN